MLLRPEDGAERVPYGVLHETMPKPADAWQVKDKASGASHLFPSIEEAAAAMGCALDEVAEHPGVIDAICNTPIISHVLQNLQAVLLSI